MADDVDVAQRVSEVSLQASLANCKKNVVHLEPRGYCHNPMCEEDFEGGLAKNPERKFCNGQCATEYEKYK